MCHLRDNQNSCFLKSVNMAANGWNLLCEYKELFFLHCAEQTLLSDSGMGPWALSVSAQLKGINLDKRFTVLSTWEKKSRSMGCKLNMALTECRVFKLTYA